MTEAAALLAGAGPQWSKIFLLPCHVLRGRSGKIESNRVAPEGGVAVGAGGLSTQRVPVCGEHSFEPKIKIISFKMPVACT